MKIITRTLVILPMLIMISVLCNLFPDLFTYDMFILALLMNLIVDKIWES